MKRALLVGVCFLATVILFIPAARAALVTIDFTGSIRSSAGFTSPSYSFGSSTITGSYTYDDATLDVEPGDQTVGRYPNALTNLTGTATYGGGGSSSFQFGASGGDITIWDDHITEGDAYEVIGDVGVFDNDLPGYDMNAFRLSMKGSNSSLSSDLLQVPPLFGNVFSGVPAIALTFAPTPTTSFPSILVFQINSLTVGTTPPPPAPVPEPSTMLLLGSGLAGLVGYGRRRMKK
jgi:hypothetical protein